MEEKTVRNALIFVLGGYNSKDITCVCKICIEIKRDSESREKILSRLGI